MLKVVLPIYYTQEFKTKPSKTILVGMNWYRNAHYFISNEVKKHYHELITNQLKSIDTTSIEGTYTLQINIYYKNSSCDGSNIASLMEKYILDSLQTLGVVSQDNVKFHLGTSWSIIDQDKDNPRAEITIKPTQS